MSDCGCDTASSTGFETVWQPWFTITHIAPYSSTYIFICFTERRIAFCGTWWSNIIAPISASTTRAKAEGFLIHPCTEAFIQACLCFAGEYCPRRYITTRKCSKAPILLSTESFIVELRRGNARLLCLQAKCL